MKIKKVEPKARKFKEIEVREPLARDYVAAERIAGTSEGLKFTLALMSQCCKFDGEKLPPEELESLGGKDFLQLANALLDTSGLGELGKQYLSSADTEDSASRQ